MKINEIETYYPKVCLHGSMNMYEYKIEQDLVGKCKCIRNVNVNAVKCIQMFPMFEAFSQSRNQLLHAIAAAVNFIVFVFV